MWHKKHYPSTYLLFFLKGEGSRPWFHFLVPLGEATQNFFSRVMPSRVGTEGASRHPPTTSLGATDQLLLMDSQAGGRSGLPARLQGPQLLCWSWSYSIFFNTSEERVLSTEQLKPPYTTSRAQKGTAAATVLKISGRWKLLVCHVVPTAARDPLHLQLALRKVYNGSLDWPGDRKKNRESDWSSCCLTLVAHTTWYHFLEVLSMLLVWQTPFSPCKQLACLQSFP